MRKLIMAALAALVIAAFAAVPASATPTGTPRPAESGLRSLAGGRWLAARGLRHPRLCERAATLRRK